MAGKGSNRRTGSDDKKFREGHVDIKGFKHDRFVKEDFEEKFMSKEAADTEAPLSGKYFISD